MRPIDDESKEIERRVDPQVRPGGRTEVFCNSLICCNQSDCMQRCFAVAPALSSSQFETEQLVKLGQ
jgi:hypothetical protein